MTTVTNRKLNILIAIESFFDGGAEMFAIRLANELALSQNVYFIELYPWLTKDKRQLTLLDIKKVKLFQPGQNNFGQWLHKKRLQKTTVAAKFEQGFKLWNRTQIKRFIKRYHISIVNSHSWDSDVYFANLRSELSFKLISSFHGHYDYVADKRESFSSFTASSLKIIDDVIYTSPRHTATLEEYEYPAVKRHKIFYGVPMEVSSKITRYRPDECLRLVMVARGIKEKGWEEAIQAVLQVEKKYSGRLKLSLVGEGAYLDELKIKYEEPALSFEGYRKNVKEWIEKAHIGLLPTTYIAESLPNTVIEYLFSGKPVIATNTGAIAEMMQYNGQQAGQCIALQNGKPNINYVAAAIENYINDPDLVEKQSGIALQAARKFMMEKCIQDYLEVFSGKMKVDE